MDTTMDGTDKKRFRTSNFTLSEKKLLLRLAIQHREILENRMTNAATNVAKIRCWEEIASQFNANSGDIVRSPKMLRSKYEVTKKELRKKLTLSRQSAMEKGGGPLQPDLFGDLTEEEKEMFQNMILSAHGMEPIQCDSDAGFGTGLTYEQVTGREDSTTLAQDEVVSDLDSYSPAMLQTEKPCRPSSKKSRCVTHPVFRRKRRLAMEKFADKKMQLLQIKEQILNEQLAAAIAYKNSQLIQLRIKEVELAAVECKCTCRAEVERARSAPSKQ